MRAWARLREVADEVVLVHDGGTDLECAGALLGLGSVVAATGEAAAVAAVAAARPGRPLLVWSGDNVLPGDEVARALPALSAGDVAVASSPYRGEPDVAVMTLDAPPRRGPGVGRVFDVVERPGAGAVGSSSSGCTSWPPRGCPGCCATPAWTASGSGR